MRLNTGKVLLLLLLAAALPALPAAQTPAARPSEAPSEPPPPKTADKAVEAQSSARPLTNTDLIAYSQEMQDDDSVLKLIEASDIRFDLSSDGLIALKKGGVSDRVILGMLEASRRSSSAAAAGPAPALHNGSGSTPPAPAASVAVASPAAAAHGGSEAAPPAASAPPASAALPPGLPETIPPAGAGSIPGMPALDPKSAAALQTAFSRLQAMGYGGAGAALMGGASPAVGMPRVFLLADATKLELPPSSAQQAVSKFKGGGPSAGAAALSSLASEALSFAAAGAGPTGMASMSGFSMVSGMFFAMRPRTPSITYAWGLPGAHSVRSVPQPAPSFELLYKELPGIDPDAFEPVVVRLAVTKDNYRIVGATRQKMSQETMMSGGGNGEWVAEERLPVRLVKRVSGDCELQVTKPLPPGEYAVVFRPARHYKAHPSAFGSGDQLTAAVWDFSLPAAAAQTAPARH